MEQTRISQAFVDIMHASEDRKKISSNFLSSVQLVKRQILVNFYTSNGDIIR